MHPIDIYKASVQTANFLTFLHLDKQAPYEPGSPEHEFWLTKFDEAMARHYGKRRSDG